MNILILNWRDPQHPLAGGAEISLFHHASYWKSKGAQITWCASSYKGSKGEENKDGILYIRRGSHFTSFIQFFIFFLRSKKHYDVIIDCFHFFPYFSIFYRGKPKVIGLINEVAGKIWFENLFFPLAAFGFILEPFIIRKYKKQSFITGSESARDDLLKVGLSSKKIHVIHHGFTPWKRSLVAKKIPHNLVFLARISKDKGIEDAIEVVDRISKKHKNVHLTIIGKSESEQYQDHIVNMIKKRKLGQYCKIVGFATEDQKFSILSKAKLLIHPSIKEGWGLNVIEANSVGTPAIGYRVAGLVDSIVDGKTGRLVEQNIESLYSGTLSLLEDDLTYKKMCKEAILWSKKFSWEEAGRESFKLINDQIRPGK